MNPVFFAENVSDNGYARLVGSEEEHLQLGLIQEDIPFKVYRAIALTRPPTSEKSKKELLLILPIP